MTIKMIRKIYKIVQKIFFDSEKQNGQQKCFFHDTFSICAIQFYKYNPAGYNTNTLIIKYFNLYTSNKINTKS